MKHYTTPTQTLRSLAVMVLIAIAPSLQAQVGVGTTSPDASAILDMSSATKGMLPPRMSTTQRNAISSPAKGLMVFDSTLKQYYYYNGTAWTGLADNGAGWSTTGNSGTSSSTNFIGTTDAQALRFRANNVKAGNIDYLSGPGNTAFGYQANSAATGSTTAGRSNVAIGYQAAMSLTTNSQNTVVGFQALSTQNYVSGTTDILTNNTAIGFRTLANNNPSNSGNGMNNTAVGTNSLTTNTTGYHNTAVGSSSLMGNTTGNYNSAIGYEAALSNSTGNHNIAMGPQALRLNTTGGNNVALGSSSLQTQSYSNGGSSYSTDNVAVGYRALTATQPTSSSNGYRNTGIGSNALQTNTNGYNNTALGYNADVSAATLNNATAIGANAVVSASNSLVLGNSANVGIGTSAPSKKLEVSGTTKTDSLQAVNFSMSNGAANGYVLQSNASGNASWVSPSTLYTSTWTTSGSNQYSALAGNIGIGTNTPSKKLEVSGTTKTDSLQATNLSMSNGAANGYILQSNVNGNASWVNPSTLFSNSWTTNGNDIYKNNTGKVGIGTNTPQALLHVNEGALLIAGTIGSGDSVVMAGSGTRMSFNPYNSSFRAGHVVGTQWDNNNTGNYSAAFGLNTIASGSNTFAAGSNSQAYGSGSFAAGVNAVATAQGSVAIGYNDSANGAYSFATGSQNTVAGDNSFAAGYNNTATQPGTFTAGLGNYNNAYAATVIGTNDTVSGNHGVAFGQNNKVTGALGFAANGYNMAEGENSTALGNNNTSSSFAETVIGLNAETYTASSTQSYTASDRLFVVGNGASTSSRSNAMTILKNGNVGIGTSLPNFKLHITGLVKTDSLLGTKGNFTDTVAIGTATPAAKLDVNGTAKIGVNGTALTHIITASATTSSASIGANVTYAQTYTVNNAEVGSAVMVSPSAAITNGLVIAYARVSAANTVEVSYRNITPGSVTLNAGVTLYIAIIK